MNGLRLAALFNKAEDLNVLRYSRKVVARLPPHMVTVILDKALFNLAGGLSNRRDGTDVPQTIFGAFRRELREGGHYSRAHLKLMGLW